MTPAVLAVTACMSGPRRIFWIAHRGEPAHQGALPSVEPGALEVASAEWFAAPEPGPELTATLAADAEHYRWAAAVDGIVECRGIRGRPLTHR